MKRASLIFNTDGTITLLCGMSVQQFNCMTSVMFYCGRNDIDLIKAKVYEIKNHTPCK